MPNLNIIKLITLKVFEILTPKADIRQKLSFYYRPKFNLGTEWNQEKYWSSLQDSFFTGSSGWVVQMTMSDAKMIWQEVWFSGGVVKRYT